MRTLPSVEGRVRLLVKTKGPDPTPFPHSPLKTAMVQIHCAVREAGDTFTSLPRIRLTLHGPYQFVFLLFKKK